MNLRLETPQPAVRGRGEGHGRLYGGQTGEERDACRRERLLVALHDIVGTRGYNALAVERLCAAANVSSRNFYQLYDGKEAAFADLYDLLLKRSGNRLAESLAATADLPIEERIPAALVAFLKPMFDDPRTARICFVEAVGLSARIEATRMQNRELLIELIEGAGATAVDAGELTGRDFRFAAIALISATTALAYDWMTHDPRQPSAWLEHKLTQLAVHLLTA